jgi:hypothetical protein
MKRIQQPWLNNDFIFRNSKISTELDEMMEAAREYLNKIVNHNKKLHIESNGAIGDDRVIDLLLDPKYEFSNQEIFDEMIIFALTVRILSKYNLKILILTSKTISVI